MKVILTLALFKGSKICQIDLNNEILNGELIEDVYMVLSLGFELDVLS